MNKISLLLLAGFLVTSNAYADGNDDEKKKTNKNEKVAIQVLEEVDGKTHDGLDIKKAVYSGEKLEGTIESENRYSKDGSHRNTKVKKDEDGNVETVTKTGTRGYRTTDSDNKLIESEYDKRNGSKVRFENLEKGGFSKETISEDGEVTRIIRGKDNKWQKKVKYQKNYSGEEFKSENVREVEYKDKTKHYLRDSDGDYFYKEKLSGGKELIDTKGTYGDGISFEKEEDKEGLIRVITEEGEVVESIRHKGDRLSSYDCEIGDVDCKDYIEKTENNSKGKTVTTYKDGEVDAVKKFDKAGNPRGSYKRELKKKCIADGYAEKGCNSMSGKEKRQCKRAVKKSCKK
ncbi:MAG: hypothetical protein N4A44_04710 [Alphaproteobacteria bacterium]|jgi:hypothetical protein|nr:hypothetical protein [Alphaproteobacteria bacterium]